MKPFRYRIGEQNTDDTSSGIWRKSLGEVIPPMATLVFDVEMMEFIGPTSTRKKMFLMERKMFHVRIHLTKIESKVHQIYLG